MIMKLYKKESRHYTPGRTEEKHESLRIISLLAAVESGCLPNIS
jgi:hypothetical protein